MTASWGEPADGLRLGIGAGAAGTVTLTLANISATPLEVLSHVLAGEETHYDWYTVFAGERTIRLLDRRNRSATVRVTLAAGEELRHVLDIAAWARRTVNGGAPLAPGRHEARARYEVHSHSGVWSGRLVAGPAELRV